MEDNKKKIIKKPVVKKKIVSKKVPVKKKVVSKKVVKKPVVKKKEKIEIKNIQDVLKIVGNKEYFEIYNGVNELDKSFFDKGMGGTFESKNQVRDFFKERVLDFLGGVYTDLKSDISHLRKTGREVDYIDFEVLTIPFKIKMLGANFGFKDFLKVKELIDVARKEINVFKAEEEKQEKEKEAKEKALNLKKENAESKDKKVVGKKALKKAGEKKIVKKKVQK